MHNLSNSNSFPPAPNALPSPRFIPSMAVAQPGRVNSQMARPFLSAHKSFTSISRPFQCGGNKVYMLIFPDEPEVKIEDTVLEVSPNQVPQDEAEITLSIHALLGYKNNCNYRVHQEAKSIDASG